MNDVDLFIRDCTSIFESLERVKRFIRNRNPFTYERWKAGGFLIDSDIISSYPNLEEVLGQISTDHNEDETEDVDAHLPG